jgi:hypothetical protein
MKFWFQVIISIGILAVSAASIAYTWQTWRSYNLERRAEEICKFYLDQKAKEYGETEKWMARRSCINNVMGKFTSD